MSEHHGSSSSDETLSEHESASVTSLDDGKAIFTAYHHLKEHSKRPPHAAENKALPIFPFSLLSACSAQGRAATMCQYARSITSQDTVSSAKDTTGPRGE